MSDNPIYGYLETLPKDYRVSDFHMRSGSTLAMRVNGEIEVMQDLHITHETLDGLFREELSAEDYDKFCQTRDIDFAMTVSGQRFRASGYHTMRG